MKQLLIFKDTHNLFTKIKEYPEAKMKRYNQKYLNLTQPENMWTLTLPKVEVSDFEFSFFFYKKT